MIADSNYDLNQSWPEEWGSRQLKRNVESFDSVASVIALHFLLVPVGQGLFLQALLVKAWLEAFQIWHGNIPVNPDSHGS